MNVSWCIRDRQRIFHISPYLSLITLLLTSRFKRYTDFCHVRPTSVTCSSLSSRAMVPYVCQNVYVVCFFRPDLFTCLPSNEPRSPSGSEPKASRYLYRPNSWGPPSQSSEGWLEKLSWKLQVKPSVGNFSLFIPLVFFSLFFFSSLQSSSPSFVFLSWVSTVAKSGRVQFRSAGPPCRRHIFWSSFVILCTLSYLVFFFTPSATDDFHPILLLRNTLRSPAPDFSPLQLCINTFLSLCCAGQSRPAGAELSFLCSFAFLLLRGSCGAHPLL